MPVKYHQKFSIFDYIDLDALSEPARQWLDNHDKYDWYSIPIHKAIIGAGIIVLAGSMLMLVIALHLLP